MPRLAEELAPATPSQLFPLHAGDRWAYRSEDALLLRGITALDGRGDAYLFGDGLTQAGRFRVDGDDILRVLGPDALVPWLPSPARAGRRWSYVSGEASCEASYVEAPAVVAVAGLSLRGCARVRRSCRHPQGRPFARATIEQHEETYCPDVGLVREQLHFQPPPSVEGVRATQTEELVDVRVVGGPLPPERDAFDCDALLLLETDVESACGPTLRRAPTQPAPEPDVCERVFQSPTGALVVRVRRLERLATDADLTDELASDTQRLGVVDGRYLIVLAPSEACPRERASRLLPLLRSVSRRPTPPP